MLVDPRSQKLGTGETQRLESCEHSPVMQGDACGMFLQSARTSRRPVRWTYIIQHKSPLASASHVNGENLDLKAQRAFVAGIDCDITGPELRYAREDPHCTMAKLIDVARKAEMHYKLKRFDPTREKETPTQLNITSSDV
eukprot:GHVT01076696.1.p1 GENE.GHVT01076696.1~~GHVT01076696.1.p1  ORF type:complete len:140 (+),score=5.30 GHVT01076696.1:295-714(+)